MKKTYERWSEYAIPSISHDEEKSCTSWPTYFIKEDIAGNIIDLLGKEISFFPKHPNDIDWDDQKTQLRRLQKNISPHVRQRINYWNSSSVGKPWFTILEQLLIQYKVGVAASARIQAVLQAGINDSLIASRKYKNVYDCARPIQLHDDIMVYAPFTNTPGFPSENTSIAGTVSTIIGYFFPEERDTLAKLAQDCAETRNYSGTHFLIDTEEGLNLGNLIGDAVISQLMREKQTDNSPVDTIYTSRKPKLSIEILEPTSERTVTSTVKRRKWKPLKPASYPNRKRVSIAPKPTLFV